MGSKYEQLKQAVRKAIKPACEYCGGRGNSILLSDGVTHVSPKGHICIHCKGLGYIEELVNQ